MRLLIAGPARIRNKRIIAEPHKRRPVERLHGNGARRYVDLSHVIADGVVTYPGLPAVHVCDYLSREQSRDHYEAGTEFQIASIEMVANRSEEHTSELQSLMRTSYAVFCLKKKKQ